MKTILTRRRFVTLSGGALAACALPRGVAQAAKSRPNVLVLHADQHRADCLGCYGNPEIRTPHLDALAQDGTRYDNAFCPYPMCTPSRYSLLSGRYVHDHRGWSNQSTLAPDLPTFPRVLRQAGYRTAAVGKMHFNPTYLDAGFDRMILAEQDGPGRWDDDYHRALRDAGLVDANDLEDQRKEYRDQAPPVYRERFGAFPSNLPLEYHSTEWIGARAMDVLDGWSPQGNLLMAAFIKPHHPFDPPREWCDAYDPAKLTLRPGWTPECPAHDLALNPGYFPNDSLTESALRRVMAYYYAGIEQIDRQVGRLTARLKEKGLYDNTMIVYTSDHGEYLGFHHMLLKGGYMYDPLARVPLIIKYPGSARAGQHSDALSNNIDIAPTILRQAGCAPGSGMRGLDLSEPGKGHDFIFSEALRARQRMVRTRKSKLLVSQKPDAALLFDLERDPLEMDNRYGDPQYAKERKRLEAALKEWDQDCGAQPDYQDAQAPIIAQPNVPRRDDEHRAGMETYYRKKMDDWRKQPR